MDALYNVEIEYRMPIRGGHMLKVHFHDLGMYIDGWTVRAATNSPSGWWFQSPARKYNGKFISMIEFAKTDFWLWLEAEAIRIVEAQDDASTTETIKSSSKGLDTVYDVPDEMYGDEATRNKYLSDAIDQTMLKTGIEPTKQPGVDPWKS